MDDGASMTFESSFEGHSCHAELNCSGETVYLTIEARDSDGTQHQHMSTFKDARDYAAAVMGAFIAEWGAKGLPRGEAP